MSLYYFINERNEQQGPVAPEQLLSYGVNRNTQVWTQGMPLWKPAGEVAELAYLFTAQSGAVPPPFQNTQTPPLYQSPSPVGGKPDSWLVWSILATIFCCLPFGIAGIIYGSKVDSLWSQRKYTEAQDAANKARTFCLIALGSGIVVGIFYFILGFIGAL